MLVHDFFPKIGKFSISFYLRQKKSEENAFYDILDIKKAFTEYKNINL